MKRPAVLTFSGLDPTGGAGIAADIRTMDRAGAHCLPLVTALTSQDTDSAHGVSAVAAAVLQDQLDVLLNDITPAAIKIGLVPDAAIAAVIAAVCQRLPEVPVVGDPVLSAGGGGELAATGMARCWREVLMPWVTIATPNQSEMQRIFGTGAPVPGEKRPCLLITTTDAGEDPIVHRLYRHDGGEQLFSTPRLAGQFHGSGCTLAAALAALLAQDRPLPEAVSGALQQAQLSLRNGFPLGRGQWIPG